MTVCCREYTNAVESYTVQITAPDSAVVIAATRAAGRKYRIEGISIVQAAGAVADLNSGGTTVCPMSAANTGAVAAYLVDGEELVLDGTGTGDITAVFQVRWL